MPDPPERVGFLISSNHTKTIFQRPFKTHPYLDNIGGWHRSDWCTADVTQ